MPVLLENTKIVGKAESLDHGPPKMQAPDDKLIPYALDISPSSSVISLASFLATGSRIQAC